MNWRITALLLIIGVIVIVGLSLIEPLNGASLSARAQLQAPPQDISGFTRAIEPWDWQFPRDHGAHPRFRTEWWYYTGVLATVESRRFGYQFTIFRSALAPQAASSESEFRTNHLYMAHFTVSDIAGGDFYHDVRYARGGAGLAGATVEPRYRVWLEDWEAQAENADATVTRISATSGDFAIDLRLEQVKPPALQGDNGLSQKSEEVGNASYYYSLSRLITSGDLVVGGERFAVAGNTWMDHEFGTSALGENAQGWDWFGLIFADNSELMVGQIRLADGGIEPAFGGLAIHPDGSARRLYADDISIEATARWRSPHSEGDYPAAWTIEVRGADGFRIDVTPLLADQELNSSGIIYWEGAVRVSGDKTGYGYAELTGYVGSMANRL